MHIFRVIFCLLVAAFLAISPIKALGENTLGLWVEAEGKNQPFRSKEETLKYLEFISNNKFKEIYLQVYREGRSWFPSKLADQTPYQRSLANGYDPIKTTLELAHSKGIKVFAWINVLRVDKNAPLLKAYGKEVVLEDNLQRSVLDYDSFGKPPKQEGTGQANSLHLDTPGVWLDPSSEKVQKYLGQLVGEIISSYPELDGIHLDMIRFPFFEGGNYLSFPYGSAAKEKFFAKYGKYPPEDSRCKKDRSCGSLEQWNVWRRSKLADVIKSIKNVLEMNTKKYELSAAVIANLERAYRHAFQNWKAWLRYGLLDKVLIMNYAKDTKSFDLNLKSAMHEISPNQVFVGIGAWLFLDSSHVFNEQLRLAKAAQAGGTVLFSYSNLLNSKGTVLLNSIKN